MESCSYCHGKNAMGLNQEATGLEKDSPNLMQRLQNHTDGDFHWKIITGKGDMPSFKDDLSDEEIWDTINYIKSLSN